MEAPRWLPRPRRNHRLMPSRTYNSDWNRAGRFTSLTTIDFSTASKSLVLRSHLRHFHTRWFSYLACQIRNLWVQPRSLGLFCVHKLSFTSSTIYDRFNTGRSWPDHFRLFLFKDSSSFSSVFLFWFSPQVLLELFYAIHKIYQSWLTDEFLFILTLFKVSVREIVRCDRF